MSASAHASTGPHRRPRTARLWRPRSLRQRPPLALRSCFVAALDAATLGPDTNTSRPDDTARYRHGDPSLLGFSHTHPQRRSWIAHETLVGGGELAFKVAATPSASWARAAEDRPPGDAR